MSREEEPSINRKEKIEARYRTMFQEYPDVVTPAQMQKMLGISTRLTYQLLHNGEIKSVRIGRIYRIPKTAIIDYLSSAYNEEIT